MSDSSEVPPASPAVGREWARRIEAEYRSSATTAELCLWLIQLGFPRELIDDGLRIVTDELDHAELSAEVCRVAGAQSTPRLDPKTLALPRHPDGLIVDTLGATLRYFCLGETVAVPLFVELRSQCIQPTARAALDRVLTDEVRHRQFGWDVLEYFVDNVPGSVPLAERLLPTFFEQLRATYGRLPREDEEVGPAERAWGLMPASLYRSILEDTYEKQYKPRFSSLNISIGDRI